MADVFKILGQKNECSTLTILYTVPVPVEVRRGATQTLITSLIVCNAGVNGNYGVKLRKDRVTTPPDTDVEYLIKARALDANNTDILSLGLALPGDAQIWVESSTDDFSFNLLGIEIS